jgi:hypothetical protein
MRRPLRKVEEAGEEGEDKTIRKMIKKRKAAWRLVLYKL